MARTAKKSGKPRKSASRKDDTVENGGMREMPTQTEDSMQEAGGWGTQTQRQGQGSRDREASQETYSSTEQAGMRLRNAE